MAIPFAKLTVVIGAGIVGSILVNEGRFSDVPSFISGAFKIVRKHLQEDKSNSSSSKKSGSDYIMTQVHSLRQQLQTLQASGPVTIVTTNRQGSGFYSVTTVLIIGAVGYGYIWWKGWKISDMMFVTRRGLSDACSSVAKQLDFVSSSVSTTKQHLSSRIDRVDCTLEDCLEVTVATKGEVSELHGELSGFHGEVESVHRAVQTLESKIVQMEGSQDFTTQGVYHLCQFVKKLDKQQEHSQILRSNSLRPALDQPQVTPICRTGSLPPIVAVTKPASPSTPVEPARILQSSRTATAASLKDVQGLSSITRTASLRRNSEGMGGPEFPNRTLQVVEGPSSTVCSSSSSGRFGWRLPSLNILSRTRSTTDAT